MQTFSFFIFLSTAPRASKEIKGQTKLHEASTTTLIKLKQECKAKKPKHMHVVELTTKCTMQSVIPSPTAWLTTQHAIAISGTQLLRSTRSLFAIKLSILANTHFEAIRFVKNSSTL